VNSINHVIRTCKTATTNARVTFNRNVKYYGMGWQWKLPRRWIYIVWIIREWDFFHNYYFSYLWFLLSRHDVVLMWYYNYTKYIFLFCNSTVQLYVWITKALSCLLKPLKPEAIRRGNHHVSNDNLPTLVAPKLDRSYRIPCERKHNDPRRQHARLLVGTGHNI